VPFGDGDGFVTWEPTENSDVCVTSKRVLEVLQMAFAANLIEDHASDIQIRIKTLETVDQRGHASGHG
jgi:hypothetical protein